MTEYERMMLKEKLTITFNLHLRLAKRRYSQSYFFLTFVTVSERILDIFFSFTTQQNFSQISFPFIPAFSLS